MRLKDKVMIITGGASGIGQATALLCAREGARVVVVDIADADGVNTERILREQWREGLFIHADVTSERDWLQVMDSIETKYGALDVLFNNAGSNLVKPLTEITEEEWDKILAINLKGAFLGMKHAIPLMLKRDGGSIINTSSIFGLIGNPNMAPYCASKGGLIALTQQVALDYARYNIRANCICPGFTMTTRVRRYADEGLTNLKSIIARIPVGRAAEPAEMATMVLFLASDESSYVSGTVQLIDGGLLAY